MDGWIAIKKNLVMKGHRFAPLGFGGILFFFLFLKFKILFF